MEERCAASLPSKVRGEHVGVLQEQREIQCQAAAHPGEGDVTLGLHQLSVETCLGELRYGFVFIPAVTEPVRESRKVRISPGRFEQCLCWLSLSLPSAAVKWLLSPNGISSASVFGYQIQSSTGAPGAVASTSLEGAAPAVWAVCRSSCCSLEVGAKVTPASGAAGACRAGVLSKYNPALPMDLQTLNAFPWPGILGTTI